MYKYPMKKNRYYNKKLYNIECLDSDSPSPVEKSEYKSDQVTSVTPSIEKNSVSLQFEERLQEVKEEIAMKLRFLRHYQVYQRFATKDKYAMSYIKDYV